ncbi:hypothetical protein [Nitratireductor sp. ZSWI3]|uniref:hypothetical protein n=1 Tax=Nitratireductor sp. ZSWI3 TaxID=2966359 RepID=UPI00214FBA8A|nr:hypothetical protein [Nitratireductor sp. ZSWI3]MCR4267544.1 hypothetical protein [Nitratireductor sp. ZSWI3]
MARAGNAFEAILGFAAGHARLFLIAGLAVGVAMPGAAQAAKPFIAEMIAALLFLSALRVGPKQLIGAVRDFRHALTACIAFQLVLPLLLTLAFLLAGWNGPLATALVLMAAAAPISGSPHLAIMTGNDPAPVLRVMTMGTALLPLTVIPVFWLTPALGEPAVILSAAARLLTVIAVAVLAAFALRRFVLKSPGPATIRSLDGISAIVMGVVVIGLMSAVGETLWTDPGRVALNLGVAFAANFALQLAVTTVLEGRGDRAVAAPLGIAAGNRNIGLFLTALPAAVTDPLLLFIGCYQIPIYLTPLILGRFYRKRAPAAVPHRSAS